MAISVLGGLLYAFWYVWRILVYTLGGLRHLWPQRRGAGSSSCPGPGLNASTSRCPDARNTAPGPGLPDPSTSATPDARNLARFDVFLNHRGPDVKMTFVAHLDAELRRFRRDPFLDAKSLVKGHHALNSINEALTGVRVHVAVISPGYAKSKYCLNELCDMLASKKPIIPVFYKVEPENLRWAENEKGPFAEAFRHHLKRGRDRDVLKWKEALKEVADITGFRFADKDNERRLVEKVAAAVLNALPAPRPLPPARHPVGLKETSTHVVNMLHNIGDNVGVMGIWGMGGIGKTTLAREVYNQEQSKFKRRCFLKDVKDARGTTIMDLQMRMVTDLLGADPTKMCWDYARCFEMIQEQKILLVVDDISETKQFYELIPDLNQLAPGSRVLITSRESNILYSLMENMPQPQRSLYLVPGLNPLDSLELFIRCAFKTKILDEVDAYFHKNVKKTVEACGGVPLALEVIGGFLADKKDQPKCWTEALSVLRNNEDIISRLKISYDGLVNEDRCMFLDIACFMLGHPRDIVLKVKDSVVYGPPSWYSLDRLVNKCLVKVDAEGQLYMHDLLRDMGRKIVVDSARSNVEMQTHVWDPLVATKILKREHGSNEALIALSLVGMDPSIVCKAITYSRMTELKYVSLDNCLVHGDFSGWSEELRWLQWRSFPHEGLPQGLKLPNLVVLDLANSVHLSRVWATDIKIECPCRKLQILILSGCKSLVELPASIGNLANLETLWLDDCEAIQMLPASFCELTRLNELYLQNTAVRALPQDFGKLSCLTRADFTGCKSLVELPASIGNLANLETLLLGGCEALQMLPASFCELTRLNVLNLCNTAVRALPQDFGKLSCLTHAYFTGCKSLVELPASFGNLATLETLWLDGCEALQMLPTSFCELTTLNVLNLCNTAVRALPQDFGKLSCLTRADFTGCKSLVELPASVGNLATLETLLLGSCEALQMLPASFCELTRLNVLNLCNTAVRALPQDFGKLCCLTRAYFIGCKSLVELPASFGNLATLETLWLDGCEALQMLPTSFCELTRLNVLYLENAAVRALPQDFGKLSCLTCADFTGCKSLVELPASVGNLATLETLLLGGCEALQMLPASFCELTRLNVLYLENAAVRALPQDFGKLSCLTRADFTGCKSLVELPASFGNLATLETLWLDGCEALQMLPTSFCELTTLNVLNLCNTAVRALPQDFGKLSCLTHAYFTGCKSLVELPASFGNLAHLETLHLKGCVMLQFLPIFLPKLTKLKVLVVEETALEGLPEDFGSLIGLKEVYFSFCKSFTLAPESMLGLSNLEVLHLDGCDLVWKLPPSICWLKDLREICLSYMALEELPEEFGLLPSLRHADFEDCHLLRSLCVSFGLLDKLQVLNLRGCRSLIQLPESFSKLSNLESLDVRGCTLLQTYPQSTERLCVRVDGDDGA